MAGHVAAIARTKVDRELTAFELLVASRAATDEIRWWQREVLAAGALAEGRTWEEVGDLFGTSSEHARELFAPLP
jgi:hypothetical protein